MNKLKQKELIETALEYRKRAYCPYSNYKVGAAVLTEKGNIYGGCNIENVSYGLAMCAERMAVFTAVANKEQVIKAIALTCKGANPCGACRQVISEFADKNIQVFLIDAAKKGKMKVKVRLLKDILPFAMTRENAGLGKKSKKRSKK